MDRAGDWICCVLHRGVWVGGVVHGVCEEARVRAVCDLPDRGGDRGTVFCGADGMMGRSGEWRVASNEGKKLSDATTKAGAVRPRRPALQRQEGGVRPYTEATGKPGEGVGASQR